ncbi:MAG: carbohydrate ABC transporter permease [Lachnospiraceae bacterium]
MSANKKEKMIGYCFIIPAVLYMLIFIGYPIFYNWIISFQDVTATTLGSNSRDFVGLENYKMIFADTTFKTTLKNTFIYTIGCLTIQFTFGFLLALFFKQKFKISKPIRGFIVISWMLPVTVTALIFKFMFAEGNGIINSILLNIGIVDQPIGWLLSSGTAMFALIIANSWVGIPFNMLLLTTGLNDISEDIYEAASLDGATVVQKFVKITLPLLRSTILSVLILGFVLTFKVFDLVYVMTGGGPVDGTEVLSTYSYKLSFKLFRFGEGTAVANVLFLCLVAIAFLYLTTISKEEAA